MHLYIRKLLVQEIDKIINKFCIEIDENTKNEIVKYSYQDLYSFSKRDPSSKSDMSYILLSYKSYYAVLVYRVAQYIFIYDKILARKLSEYAKLKSGIEIHPGAKIGKSFVLDHGIGTVIGETTIIGERCYILQNVVLGAAQIANNIEGQRHPIIGDDVEIGSFVRIYGSVKIGNGVKISPGAIIKNDVPDHSKIIVSSNYQIMRGQDAIYYTGFSEYQDRIMLFFQGKSLLQFDSVSIYIENEKVLINKIDTVSIEFNYNSKINLKDIKIYSNAGKMRVDLKMEGIKQCI